MHCGCACCLLLPHTLARPLTPAHVLGRPLVRLDSPLSNPGRSYGGAEGLRPACEHGTG